MASTQIARAAAQLHEAALDVARVAVLRAGQPEVPASGPQVPQELGLAEDEDDTVPEEDGTTVTRLSGCNPGGLVEPEMGLIAGLPCRDGERRVLQARYSGDPESVQQVRHQVTEALSGIPCADDAIYALNEVATNAVVHSRSGQDGGEFAVAVDVVPGSLVEFEVTDQGGPWQEDGPDFYLHGLGIVRELAAKVQVSGGEDGRTVRVSFPWEART